MRKSNTVLLMKKYLSSTVTFASAVSGFVSSRTSDVAVCHKGIPFQVTQPTHVPNRTRVSPVYIGGVSVSTYAKASRKKWKP